MNETETTEKTDGTGKAGSPALSAFAYWFKAVLGGLAGASVAAVALVLAASFIRGGVRDVAQTLVRALGAP